MTEEVVIGPQTEIAKLRIEIATLRARAEAAEAQLCRARAIVGLAQGLEEDEYVEAIADALSSSSPCPHEAVLCRAWRVCGAQWPTADAAHDALLTALSVSAPCPHEEEAKRLREAVEWALENGDVVVIYGNDEPRGNWKDELRRRSKEAP